MMRAPRFTPGRRSRTQGRLTGLLGAFGAAMALLLAGAATAAALPALTAFATQASGTISLGPNATISDTAVLVGDPLTGVMPTGTVTFNLYGPDDATCAKPPVFTVTVPVSATSHSTRSGPFTPTLPGTYRWIASYGGTKANPANYAPQSGRCTEATEATVVTAVTPTLTTVASPSVPVGTPVTDTATLTGGMAPTGTIRFRIYQPTDTTCAGPAVGGSDVTISDPASTVSDPYTPPIPGTFRWRAFYLGDHTNGATSTACGDPGESVDVTPGPPPPPGAAPGAPGAGAPGSPGAAGTKPAPCDPAATAHAVLAGLAATLSGQPGAGFKASCSAGLRIVLRAREIRPGNPGLPRHDGFATMTNILTHIAPNGPALSFSLNQNGLDLRDYARSKGQSLIGFLVVHVRPDKSQTSTESLQILTLGSG